MTVYNLSQSIAPCILCPPNSSSFELINNFIKKVRELSFLSLEVQNPCFESEMCSSELDGSVLKCAQLHRLPWNGRVRYPTLVEYGKGCC